MDVAGSETRETGLSEKMLHSKLAISLRNNGTLETLKSQLRAKVLSDLRAGGIIPAKRSRSLFDEAALHIVMDHLRTSGFKCSLSVFIPESGLPISSMVESGNEVRIDYVLEMLGVRQNSRLDRYIQSGSAKSGSLLRVIVEYLSQDNSDRIGFADTSSQTATEESIDQKLKRIDEKFQGLLAAEQSYPIKTFEERRVQWQREADERLRVEVEEAVARVRRVEISNIRHEEQNRYKLMLAEVKNDWEKTYQKRLEDLQKRESEALDRLERKRQEFEENSYQHRQRMLAEMNLLRQRDVESKRQAELAQSSLHKHQARLKDLEQSLELKMLQAEKSAEEQAKSNEMTLSKLKADLHREHEEGQKAVAAAQRELETQTQQLQIAREAFNDALAESRLARQENVNLRGDLERLRRQYEGLHQDLSAERGHLQRRQDECEKLNAEIDALKKQNLELESLVSSIKTSAPASRPIEPLLVQLEEMRSSHFAEKQLRDKEIRKLNAEVKAEKRYADQLKQQITDLQTEQSRHLARIQGQADELSLAQKEAAERALELKMARHEVNDLRSLLEHSQALLSKESSHPEVQRLPTRSLRATRDHRMESGQIGFDTRIAPSHSVQRLLTQARNDAAEYAATTRPRQHTMETPTDAWDVEFQRALQTIKQLEKEDLALKQSREALINGSDRNKFGRVTPTGYAAEQEHTFGAGYSKPDILRRPFINERCEDKRGFRSGASLGDKIPIDPENHVFLANTEGHPSRSSQLIPTGPLSAAPLVTEAEGRGEQDLVNLDEEAARFLFDRSEKPASDDVLRFQHPSEQLHFYRQEWRGAPEKDDHSNRGAQELKRAENAEELKLAQKVEGTSQVEEAEEASSGRELKKGESDRKIEENAVKAGNENIKAEDFRDIDERKLEKTEVTHQVVEVGDEARKPEAKEEEARKLKQQAETTRKLEEKAEAARRLKEKAEEAKKLEEQAEAARKLQEVAKEARKLQEEAEEARKLEEQAEAARKLEEKSKEARKLEEQAAAARKLEEKAEEGRKREQQAEEARKLEEKANAARKLEEQAEDARKLEEQAEDARKLEELAEGEARKLAEEAEEARKLEQQAEAARKLEQQAEEARKLEEQAEAARKLEEQAEEARKLEEHAEAARKLEELAEDEARKLEEEAEEARKLEEEANAARKLEEQAEAARKLEEQAEIARKLEEQAEEARKLEEKAQEARMLEEKAIAARKLEEQAETARKLEEEAEEARKLEQQRQKHRDEVDLAMISQHENEMQDPKLDSDCMQKESEGQRDLEGECEKQEDLQSAEVLRVQMEQEEIDGREQEERVRAQEVASKRAEGESLIFRITQAIQSEEMSEAQDCLRKARRVFQECGSSEHDSTLASCEERIQKLRVQRTIFDAEQHLNSARHEMRTPACTAAVLVRARDSVQEAKKLLAQIPPDADEARYTLSQSIFAISNEIDAVASTLGAKDDDGTDHLYMQCFQQEEGLGTDSDSPLLGNDTQIHHDCDDLDVQSFHYSEGEVDEFGTLSVGSNENEYF